MTSKVGLKATWNLDPLPSSEQTTLAYLLVDIAEEENRDSPAAVDLSKVALNLSLVLDTSGSMSGAKLQNLKKAVGWVIDHLSPQSRVAVTLFDDEVHPLVASTQITDPEALHEQIDKISEAGGTAMSKGLEVGLEEAIKGRATGVVSRILLLTDGQTWGDADRCRELAAFAGANGIPITALGVGADEDWSIELLDTIARESGGNVDYISKPEEISHAFQGAVEGMSAATARNLRITFNPAGGVSLRAVYRVAPVLARLWPGTEGGESSGSALTLPLGDIHSHAGQSLLYEVMLPPRKPGQYRLAHLLLQYERAPGDTREDDAALDLVVSFSQAAAKGPGDPRVMNSVEKATTFKLQTRALEASMAGDVASATRNLRAAATRLLGMGETELAQVAEEEARLLETTGRPSAAGTKKLAFDTRKLAVAEMDNTRAATVPFDE